MSLSDTTSAVKRLLRRVLAPAQARPGPAPQLPPLNPQAPLRIVVVANAVVPTVQLALLQPLRELVEAGEAAIDFLTEEQLKQRFGRKARAPEAQAWFQERLAHSGATCLFICRYSGPFAREAIAFAREAGVPSLYCLDDDLLNVPREIGPAKFDYHNHPLRLEAVRFLLEQADLVYVSNARLADRVARLGIQHRPYVGKLFCAGRVIAPPRVRQATTLGYMGFDHAHDFELALPALVRALRHNPQLKFELFGKIARPPALEEFGGRVIQLPVVADYEAFLQALAERQWDIGICPLARTPFNEVKNINKWIEYTAVGTAVIATRGMIYDECCADDCGWLAADDGWDEALQSLIADSDRRVRQVKQAQRRLADEYSVERLRSQVLDAIGVAGLERAQAAAAA